jgi:hypothetical protein
MIDRRMKISCVIIRRKEMVQERISGKKGIKEVTHIEALYLDKFKVAGAVRAGLAVNSTTSWDQTMGLKTLLMLGNGPDNANPSFYPNGVGDCVPVSDQNLRLFQALKSVSASDANGDQVIEFVEGFKRPHTQWVVYDRYFKYGFAQGWRGQSPAPEDCPDEGSDPTTYAHWVVSQDAEVEFSAEIDVSDAQTNPSGCLLRLKQAAVDFNGLTITVNLCPQNEGQFSRGEPFTTGPGNLPDPEEGHGLALCAFTPNTVQLATWAWADQLATDQWLLACITSARVQGTKTEMEQAGYDFDAWLAVAKTYPGFDGYGPSADPTLTTPAEVVPVAPTDDSVEQTLKQDAESIVHRVEDLIHAVPSDFKAFMKQMHKVIDAAMEKESVEVIEKLLADALKAYTHGAI